MLSKKVGQLVEVKLLVTPPSKGLTHRPEVEAQAESVTTLVPSRLRTVSRVLQVPLMVIPIEAGVS